MSVIELLRVRFPERSAGQVRPRGALERVQAGRYRHGVCTSGRREVSRSSLARSQARAFVLACIRCFFFSRRENEFFSLFSLALLQTREASERINERASAFPPHDAFHGRRFDVGAVNVDFVIVLSLTATESGVAKC